jgi:hypothetical protein
MADAFALTSSPFDAGAEIPTRYTCDGDDVSPPLAWSDAVGCGNSISLQIRGSATREFVYATRSPWNSTASPGSWKQHQISHSDAHVLVGRAELPDGQPLSFSASSV